MKSIFKKENLPLAILVVVLILLSFFKLFGNDIWMHLKAGQLILTRKAVPSHDPFTFPLVGGEWIAHEWLSQVLFYLVYQLAGVNGLVFLRVVLLAAIFACSWFLVDRKHHDLLLLCCWFLFTALLGRDRFFLRPHLFGFLGHILSLVVLYRHREKPQVSLFWLILIELFWASTHGGTAFLGSVVPIVFGAGWFLEQWLWPAHNRGFNLKSFIIIVLLVFIVSFINPCGYKIYKFSFGSYSTEIYRQSIREWAPPSGFAMLSVLAIFFLIQLTLIINSLFKRRRGLVELFFLLLYGYLAFKSVRFVALLAIVTLPGTISLLRQLVLPDQTKKFQYAKVVLFILISAWAVNSVVDQSSFQFGFGLDERKIPIKAADFLLANDLPANLFNSYYFGGYLLWRLYPQYQVFIDGRQIGEIPVFKEYLSFFKAGKRWNDVVKKYDLKVAVIAYPQYQKAVRVAAERLAIALPAQQWALVFFDDVAMVFVKRSPGLSSFIARNEFRLLKPNAADFGYLDELAKDARLAGFLWGELERSLRLSPEGVKANLFISHFYLKSGDFVAAIERLELVLEINPSLRPALNYLAVAYLKNGEEQKALSTFKDLLRLNPGDAYGWNNLGRLHLQRNEIDQAIKCFLKAVKLDSNLLDARFSLAQAFESANKIKQAQSAWRAYIELARSDPREAEWLEDAKESLRRLNGQQ